MSKSFNLESFSRIMCKRTGMPFCTYVTHRIIRFVPFSGDDAPMTKTRRRFAAKQLTLCRGKLAHEELGAPKTETDPTSKDDD